ncbi:MAG: FAD-dependent oxidoreductase [bacterium]|nr:FAD-dependent oxidoreductase [bacterium]
MVNSLIPGKNTSIWLDTTPNTNFPSLEKDLIVDTVIIGGGIAGLSTAFFLKQAGKKVAIVESQHIVKGTTGFTTAKITSAHGLIYKYLTDRFGLEKARIYAEANQKALETMSSLIESLHIEADFKRLPAYTYAVSDNDIDLIKNEVEAARRLGLPVSFTTDIPLPFPTAGAIKYENQARYHPRKYLLSLAKRINGGGSHIFEKTKVIDVEEGKSVRVRTEKGDITARDVVIATNYPIYDPNAYFARMTARQSLVIAVRLNRLVPQGLFYSTEKSFHSLRPQPFQFGEELLLSGGKVFKTGQEDDITGNYLELINWTKENFDVRSVEYHWTTNDSESHDRVPLIGRLNPDSKHLYVATGFNGWGMAHGTVAGMLLSDTILGNKNSWLKLYDPSRISNIASSRSLLDNLNSIGQMIKSKFARLPTEIDLENDEAKVVLQNGKKLAIYRDEVGKIHAISAVCTHMGCTVGWNNTEKTWDCPCHGSRFTKDGVVIHGPAIKNLEKEVTKK